MFNETKYGNYITYIVNSLLKEETSTASVAAAMPTPNNPASAQSGAVKGYGENKDAVAAAGLVTPPKEAPVSIHTNTPAEEFANEAKPQSFTVKPKSLLYNASESTQDLMNRSGTLKNETIKAINKLDREAAKPKNESKMDVYNLTDLILGEYEDDIEEPLKKPKTTMLGTALIT